MESEYQMPQESDSYGPQPHPILHEPLLYISNIPPYVSDENIALAFVSCGPFRPNIPRDGSNNPLSGTIEFKFLEKAEKALATLQSRPLPGLHPPVPLVLSPYPPTSPPTPLPPPSALPRLVKYLPPGYTDSQLYDIFRPYGALASARTPTHFGIDTGMVEFWNEDDARQAEEAMHCADVQGQNIAVQVYQPRRTSAEFSANAPSFVPSGQMFGYGNSPPASQYSPPRGSPYRSPVQSVASFVHGPGQQVQLAPITGPGSTSHSGLIDPCNLFCKNLDPDIDSNGLFSHFRQFGQIVSARVMRNENGESRGFGFVSYQTPDQASAALHAMNGVLLGTKQVVVRLHEPKQLRQEKLAQRFGHNGHPKNSSGATSPTASEGGDSYAGWGSPRHHTSTLNSPTLVGSHYERPERGRRGSGSYYNAALAGTLNLSMRYDDLYALSPVVRQEVLTGELNRRVKSLGLAPADDVEAIVESLVNISLSEVVKCIEDPVKLSAEVNAIRQSLRPSKQSSPNKSPSPSVSQDSRLLDPNSLNATASAPEHPSTPISINASLSTPPRTSSPSGSVPPTSERERILAAINKLESSRQAELTELLMSLPKRERAMCLFNVEILRAKLADAKMVLDTSDDDEETAVAEAPPVPITPQPKKVTVPTAKTASPQTPDLSSRGPSATASPSPATPSNSTHTIASLARLPAAEIVRLATSSSATGLPLPKADPVVVQATDEFIDGLLDKPPQVQKQQLGDKLFKTVKSFGIKAAPKVTIALLDQEDLRALAHLMNSYPSVLKDKAAALVPAK
ncbi:hypothetical protein C8J57DRAFT_1716740 [Mycena rebaudengoi]|nr:hypothetical protein C8J57DRAFT_1716740 [Mycena rebaudengoi]